MLWIEGVSLVTHNDDPNYVLCGLSRCYVPNTDSVISDSVLYIACSSGCGLADTYLPLQNSTLPYLEGGTLEISGCLHGTLSVSYRSTSGSVMPISFYSYSDINQ